MKTKTNQRANINIAAGLRRFIDLGARCGQFSAGGAVYRYWMGVIEAAVAAAPLDDCNQGD